MTGPGASLPLRGVSEAPLSAGAACIPRRSISDRSASLARSVSEPASPAISSSSPSSRLAYHSASRRRSFCSSLCPIMAASYAQPPNAASLVLEGAEFDLCPSFLSGPLFPNSLLSRRRLRNQLLLSFSVSTFRRSNDTISFVFTLLCAVFVDGECPRLRRRANFDFLFRLSTFDFQLSTSPPVTHHPLLAGGAPPGVN